MPWAKAVYILTPFFSVQVKWNYSHRKDHSGQKLKVLTPGQLSCSMCGTEKSCSREKLLTLAACVASPSVAASPSVGEAGQCQGAMFYELVSTKLTTFPQALHWRTWLWPCSCCSQTAGSVHCTSEHIHTRIHAHFRLRQKGWLTRLSIRKDPTWLKWWIIRFSKHWF